jgi:hypothetical protein
MIQMEHEAIVAMGMKPDKSYKGPKKAIKLFKAPDIFTTVFTISLWTLFIYMAYVEQVHPYVEPLRSFLNGIQGAQNALFALVMMHSVEVVIAIGLGIYSDLPIGVIVSYSFVIFFVGMNSLKECVKTAYKYRTEKLDQDEIK